MGVLDIRAVQIKSVAVGDIHEQAAKGVGCQRQLSRVPGHRSPHSYNPDFISQIAAGGKADAALWKQVCDAAIASGAFPAAFRPKASIFIFTSNKYLLSTMALVWGVRCYFYDRKTSTDETFHDVTEILKDLKLIHKKDVVIHLASMPIGGEARANAMKITVVE